MKKLTANELRFISKKIQVNHGEFIVVVDTTDDISLQHEIGMKNIFCVDSNNNIIWQVFVTQDNASSLQDTFMYIDIKKELKADTFFGMEYKIDLKTGEAKRIGWHK